MEIQRSPTTQGGKTVSPVTWDSNCLEEVCGSCTMVINGKVRQACTALVDNLEKPISLEPMSKFPVVRDLQVNRSRMFENLKKVKLKASEREDLLEFLKSLDQPCNLSEPILPPGAVG